MIKEAGAITDTVRRKEFAGFGLNRRWLHPKGLPADGGCVGARERRIDCGHFQTFIPAMNDVSRFLAQLFTERPYVFISWPATAMVVGTIAVKCSQGIATRLGLQPRTGRGLVGIFTAPFLHANFAHLAANLPPFVVLGWLVLRHGEKPFLYATLMIALAQGVLLWLLGRRAAHIGMSGVIFGFLGWLVTMAWLTRATADLLAAAGV
jgi:membrane associated rhomboid family serine protease